MRSKSPRCGQGAAGCPAGCCVPSGRRRRFQTGAPIREPPETWLFEENLGCSETVERLRREFGLQATASSVGRFRRRRAAERQAEDLAEAPAAAFDLTSKTSPLPNQGPWPTPSPVQTALRPPKFA
jgi:hypothetical protein